MLTILGKYQDGYVKLEKDYPSKTPVKVIITFLEDVEPAAGKPLKFSDFSFAESRKALENYKGSFSNALIEGRRNGV